MPDWLSALISLVVIFALVFGLALFLAAYFNTDFRGEDKAKLQSDLKNAIVHSQPSWDQILNIAQAHRMSKHAAFQAVLNILRELLTGADAELTPHRHLVEGYVIAYNASNPFDTLPSETRAHLQRLQEALGDRAHLLHPLTAQLKELVSMHEHQQRRQRQLTKWGFVLAVVGLVFAAYAYFYPYSSPSKSAAWPSKESLV